ncbi:MAG: hypothetical protein NTY48_06535 [Candidatus Diapherotrites archaeon]|nr:hypothetical protein [Candidatus Diapherotrites archaeon]
MPLKESFVGLYIKRFIIPGALVFNKPGFLDFKISGKTNIYARQIFYPADFFIEFESGLIKEFGEKGRQKLYSIGKKFGYRFAQAGKFENIKDHPGDKIKDWVFIASKFVEGTYASSIENELDSAKKKVDYLLKRFTILEKLGYEYIFATGGTAGLMAWIFQESSIEVVLHDLKEVNGYYEATVTAAPREYLKKQFPDELIPVEENLTDLLEDFNDYAKFNAQSQTSCSKSFQTYLDFKFFKYQDGIVTFKDKRFFLFELSGTYLLELELKKEKDKKYLEILFDSAFKVGKESLSQFGKTQRDVFDVLSALGWGEVLPFSQSEKEIKVAVNHFPWSKWYKDIDFVIMRGFLSGILSALLGKKVIFDKPIIDLSKGHLSLLFGGKYS